MATARSTKYPVGLTKFTETQVIPRQRSMIDGFGSGGAGTGGFSLPLLPNNFPGAPTCGEDKYGSVVQFDPGVTGALFQTEGYDGGHVGNSWNSNNTDGDTSLRSNLCTLMSDLSIDGQAGLNNYPYSVSGVHGTDFVQRADGLQVQGSGFYGNRLRFFQIPGTAIHLKGGGGSQAGALGLYDESNSLLDDITVLLALNGITNEMGDSRLNKIRIINVVKDGLTMNSPGGYVEDAHVYGADRACVVAAEAHFTDCYFESARFGTDVLFGADGTEFNGLNIGSGTCFGTAVNIQSDDVLVERLFGAVATGTTGVQVAQSRTGNIISGRLALLGTSVGAILSGHHNELDLYLSTQSATATFVQVTKSGSTAPTGLDCRVRGFLSGGPAIDLTQSGLDSNNGFGNHFNAKLNGSGRCITYPGFPSTNPTNAYNLAAGNFAYINEVLQTTGMTN